MYFLETLAKFGGHFVCIVCICTVVIIPLNSTVAALVGHLSGFFGKKTQILVRKYIKMNDFVFTLPIL